MPPRPIKKSPAQIQRACNGSAEQCAVSCVVPALHHFLLSVDRSSTLPLAASGCVSAPCWVRRCFLSTSLRYSAAGAPCTVTSERLIAVQQCGFDARPGGQAISLCHACRQSTSGVCVEHAFTMPNHQGLMPGRGSRAICPAQERTPEAGAPASGGLTKQPRGCRSSMPHVAQVLRLLESRHTGERGNGHQFISPRQHSQGAHIDADCARYRSSRAACSRASASSSAAGLSL